MAAGIVKEINSTNRSYYMVNDITELLVIGGFHMKLTIRIKVISPLLRKSLIGESIEMKKETRTTLH